MLAIYHSHIEAVKTLLKAGANIHAKNSRGDTPLSLAVYRANLPILALLLLSHGARADIVTKEGMSARQIAEKQCDRDIVDIFDEYESSETREL